MNKELKEILIEAASANETRKTWYVSEMIIPINDILLIENIASCKTLFE